LTSEKPVNTLIPFDTSLGPYAETDWLSKYKSGQR
jgi:hypothetical protein